MKDRNIPEELRKHEIAQCVTIIKGGGDLPKISVKTAWSTAEIYLHDAQVTGFQKNGEPTFLFMSRRSQFAVGKAIRGGRPQRLLFASTGTKDPKASDVLYIKELVAPLTVNAVPEGTLKAFANHGELGATGTGRWGELRNGFGPVRQGRSRLRRSGHEAPGRRHYFVRKILERTHGGDNHQERFPAKSRLGT